MYMKRCIALMREQMTTAIILVYDYCTGGLHILLLLLLLLEFEFFVV
jgi:hypothetical protein